MPTTDAKSRRLIPREVAELWRVGEQKVLAMIHSGELRATNLASPGSSRPRWRIDPADVEACERARQAVPSPKTSRVRRKASAGVTDFF